MAINILKIDPRESRKKYFQNYQPRSDEYINEEFQLVCKKCGGNRFFQHDSFITICFCMCQSDELEKENNRQKEEDRLQSLQKLKSLSLLGKRYENACFDNLDMNRPEDFLKAVKRCKTYCEKWNEVKEQGLGIYLYGDVGTGKSLLTACIGNYLLSKRVTVLFTNFFEIAKQIKKTFSDSSTTESEFMERLAKVDLLIIDDIGTEIATRNGEKTWIQEKIYDVINSRYVDRKPIIFSSNESLVDLFEKCGLIRKTVDRIAAMSTAKIELRGSSYRLQEQRANTLF